MAEAQLTLLGDIEDTESAREERIYGVFVDLDVQPVPDVVHAISLDVEISGSSDAAAYTWRSQTDLIQHLAQRVAIGKLALASVMLDSDFSSYVTDQQRQRADALDVPADEIDIGEIVDDIASGSIDLSMVGEPESPYATEESPHRDALEALGRLPRWARIDSIDSGGPGSGFEAAVLVLTGNHRLLDLKQWLETRRDHEGGGV